MWTFKSDVETTLKSNVETTLNMVFSPTLKSITLYQRWKLVVQRCDLNINLKTTLKQRCVTAGYLSHYAHLFHEWHTYHALCRYSTTDVHLTHYADLFNDCRAFHTLYRFIQQLIYLSRIILIYSTSKRRRSDSFPWRKPLHQQKIQKPTDNTFTPPKTSITQRLRTDPGRPTGAATAIKPVWPNRCTGTKPSHLPQKPCNQKDTHLKICKKYDWRTFQTLDTWEWWYHWQQPLCHSFL